MVPALTTCITPSGEARTCASEITTASSLVDKVKEQNGKSKVVVYSKCVSLLLIITYDFAVIWRTLSIARVGVFSQRVAEVKECVQDILPLLRKGISLPSLVLISFASHLEVSNEAILLICEHGL
jgi:hypothetical protein